MIGQSESLKTHLHGVFVCSKEVLELGRHKLPWMS